MVNLCPLSLIISNTYNRLDIVGVEVIFSVYTRWFLVFHIAYLRAEDFQWHSLSKTYSDINYKVTVTHISFNILHTNDDIRCVIVP